MNVTQSLKNETLSRQAQEYFERFIEDMKQAQGITEYLKTENALDWVGKLDNIRADVREIIYI